VTLRYEFKLDGSIPPEPGSSSPLVGQKLSLSCPSGEERSVILRYRGFTGSDAAAVGGESRLLRFTMDRKPPDPPVLAAKPPIYSDKSYSIRYKAADSSISTYVSLSTEKKSVLFKRFEKDIELAGSAVGPISYTIRSYSIIDTNTLYADTAAKDSGDGSPFKPFRTIDAVLAESSRTGKSNIYLRGKFELTTALAVDRDLAIQGGFTADWDIDPSNRSELRLVAPRNPSAFTVRAAKLALRGLAMTSSSTGSAPIILVDRGELTLEEVALSARGEGDIIMLRADSSKVFLQHASLTAVQAMSRIPSSLRVRGSGSSTPSIRKAGHLRFVARCSKARPTWPSASFRSAMPHC
jgi:hypothetical protein